MKNALYLIGVLMFVGCGLILNLIRRGKIINFLKFCGEENLSSYYAEVTNPLTLLDLEFYNPALLHYFKRLINYHGSNLGLIFNELDEIKGRNRQALCIKTFNKALTTVEANKLGRFYIQSFYTNKGDNSKLAIFILKIATNLEARQKEDFLEVLKVEVIALASYNSNRYQPVSDFLTQAIVQIKESKPQNIKS